MDSTLYIPFLDAKIGYDCVTCGAGCCKDGSIGATSSEYQFLVEKYPKIQLLFQGSIARNQYTTLLKSPPGCPFLTSGLRCGIQEKFGADRKPHVCRSHPIYVAKTAKPDFYSAYLLRGCVWLTGDLQNAVGTITWASALELHQESLTKALYLNSGAQKKSEQVEESIEQSFRTAEEKIRDAALNFENYIDYLSWQMEFSNQPTESLRTLKNAIVEFLDLGDVPDRLPEVDRFFLLFSSMIRLRLLGWVEAVRTQVSDFMPQNEMLLVLPKILLALYVYALAFSCINPAQKSNVDYNTIDGWLNQWSPRFLALSLFGEVMTARTSNWPGPVRVKGKAIVEFMALLNSSEGKTLGTLAQQFCADIPFDERLKFLDDLGIVAERLQPQWS